MVDTKYVALLAIIRYPDHTHSFAICVGVVACNHLMLSLREEAHDHHSSMEPLALASLSRRTPLQSPALGVTDTYADQL